MRKLTNLKQFMIQFIKKKSNNEYQRIKEAYKKKREECIEKFNGKNQGKDEHFDRDDFIY